MATSSEVIGQKKTTLFSKKNKKILSDPLNDNNPITVQVLGICSALAVTTQLMPSLIMSISVIFVVALANVVISLLRNTIPSKIRMIVQLVVIATLVTIVEQVLHAFAFGQYKLLSVFIGLIITNCIVMGRAEAFAMKNPPFISFLDGLGNGLGYSAMLLALAFVRELFGAGSLYGVQILPDWYVPNGMLLLPPSAFFLIGLYIWALRSWKTDQIEEPEYRICANNKAVEAH